MLGLKLCTITPGQDLTSLLFLLRWRGLIQPRLALNFLFFFFWFFKIEFLCVVLASPVYIVRSRIARSTQGNPVSEKKPPQKTKIECL